jgi:hypothetical protein
MIVVDLDAPNERPNDIAFGIPIGRLEPILDHTGKGLELTNDQQEGPGLLGDVCECGGLCFELGDAPSKVCEARLELDLVDDPFSIAVDEPADAAPELGELAIDRLKFESAGPVCIISNRR